MSNYLQAQAPVYNRFIDNQVLTESQLNAILNHLNYQDKVSRVHLTGVGIVCGLKIFRSENKISLTKGVGITTDGDLIQLEGADYESFRRFNDSNARYGRFIRNGSTVPLWELTEDRDASDARPLDKLEDVSGIELRDTVALVYLEYYHREPEDCSPVDCNSQGKEVVNRPRVLLISRGDAEHLIERDTLQTWLQDENLQPVRVKRVVHSAEQKTPDTFFSDYKKNVGFQAVQRQVEQLRKLPVFKDIMPEVNAAAILNESQLNEQAAVSQSFQYLYDFYRDLTTQLNEITDFLRQNISLCAPDTEAFPKHLLLGTSGNRPQGFRHGFYPSPALNQPVNLDRLREAYKRLLLMIRDFNTAPQEEVRITPSPPDNVPLSKRAIPFYYNLARNPKAGEFAEGWRKGGVRPVPNYYKYGYINNENPIRYHLEGYDFYRVEGMHGQSVREVQKEIQKLKRRYGLAFNVVSVFIGENADEETINYDDHRFYFDDLQAILQAWNDEQQCVAEQVADFLSGFSLEEKGFHKKRVVPIFRDLEFEFFRPIPLTISDSFRGLNLGNRLSGMKKPGQTAFLKDTGAGYRSNLGDLLKEHVKAVSSRNDIVAEIKRSVRSQIKDWPIRHVEVLIDIPLNLFGSLKETEDFKLTRIEDFTSENLEKFILSLNKQCEEAKEAIDRIQEIFNREDEELADKPWVGTYIQMLQKIQASCCLAGKMTSLYQSIIDRKKRLLDQFKFDVFIKKHPGAEHLAGVPKGGTLILVYHSADGTNKTHHGRVIGDLCLPYVCCSDTPSTTFVFPDQPVQLRLPTDHICMGRGKANPIRLEITPADAEVKAYIGDEQLKDVILKKDNGIFFSPEGVSKENYEEPIRFTVNGQIMEPTLTLFEKPVPEFLVAEQIQFNKENTIAFLTFKNLTKNRLSYQFEWDFGNGDTSDTNEQRLTIPYNVTPGEEFSTVVTLKAKGEYCRASVSETTTFQVPELDKEEEVSLYLPQNEVCTKEDPIFLKVFPEGASLQVFSEQSELENIVEPTGNGYLFHPDRVPNGAHKQRLTFRVNEQEVEPALTVYRTPEPEFAAGTVVRDKEDKWLTEITIINKTQNHEYFDFEWTINNENPVRSNDKNFKYKIPIKSVEVLELNVTLRAQNGPCAGEKTDTLSFRVPGIPDDPGEKECKSYAKERITRSGHVINSLDLTKEGISDIFKEEGILMLTIYVNIMHKIDTVLEGGLDNNIFNRISNLQNIIQNKILNSKSLSARDNEIGMILYYELALLYFYIQSCRESTIEKLEQNPRIPDWKAVTNRFLSEKKGFLFEFLQATSTLRNFTEVDNRFKERYSDDLKEEMQFLLTTFNDLDSQS